MATLYSIEELIARQEERFEQALRFAGQEFHYACGEVQTFTVSMHYATNGPNGEIRKEWLRALDHPFARRHGGPLVPVAPIGTISGDLVKSLQFPISTDSNGWSMVAKSVGVPYAEFVYGDKDTETMFARGLRAIITRYARERNSKLADDLRNFTRK